MRFNNANELFICFFKPFVYDHVIVILYVFKLLNGVVQALLDLIFSFCTSAAESFLQNVGILGSDVNHHSLGELFLYLQSALNVNIKNNVLAVCNVFKCQSLGCAVIFAVNVRPLKKFIGSDHLLKLFLCYKEVINAVNLTDGDTSLLIASRQGRALRIHESTIRVIGRTGMGVKAMKLKEGDELIDMSPIKDDQKVLAISVNGYGKRTDPEEYREQGRAGMGIRAMTLTEKTGELAAQLGVNDDEDILLITDEGVIIRMAVADIRESGRSTQGVRLMRLGENTKIVCVARAEKESEEADDEAVFEERIEETEE